MKWKGEKYALAEAWHGIARRAGGDANQCGGEDEREELLETTVASINKMPFSFNFQFMEANVQCVTR